MPLILLLIREKMIDVVATLIKYGYFAMDLPPQSNKPILVACNECGKEREASKNHYHPLCNLCAQKGKTVIEETKALISKALQGNTNALGYTHTDEQNARQSAAMKGEKHPNYGKRGEKSPNYKGGKKISKAKDNAKRKRDLDYTILLPFIEGEVGHHVTNEYVIGIPKEVHKKLSGCERKSHRAKVLKWLKANDKKKYEIVLSIFEEKL